MDHLTKKELYNIITQDVFRRGDPTPSDWIFDFRRVSLTPTFLEKYVDIFFKLYKNKAIQVCGLETASLPLLSAIVLESKKRGVPINGFFIRKSRKKHDLCKAIEGSPNSLPIVIVDDILNSGKSIMSQLAVLKETSLIVTEIFTIIRFRDVTFYDFFGDITIKDIFELNDFTQETGLKNLEKKASGSLTPLHTELLWRFKPEGANFKLIVPKSQPLYLDERIYYGTDSGNFFCLDAKSGNPLWVYKVPYGADGKNILSSPAIYKHMVYFGAYDGNVYALDKETGKKVWVYYDADWVGSSPIINTKDEFVYIGLEYGTFSKKGGIVALNAISGKEVWKDFHEGLTHNSPYYSTKNNIVLIVSNDGMLHIYNAKTGKKIKEESLGAPAKEHFVENRKGTLIAFGDFNGILYTIDTKTLTLSKRFEALFAIYSTPLWDEERIIFTSLDKTVYCYDTTKSTLVWKYSTYSRIFSSPIMHQNFIYVGSNSGKLFRLDPLTGTECGYIQLSERIVNSVFTSKEIDVLYIPTVANEVYKIRVKNENPSL